MAEQRFNAVLAALPRSLWDELSPRLDDVALERSARLIDQGQMFTRVHFPVSGVVSTVGMSSAGRVAEMATVGREGVVETGAVLGSRTALRIHVVQVPGRAFAMRFGDFAEWLQRSPEFRSVLMYYAQAFTVQVLQSAACNLVHSAGQRAARWLLTCADRNPGPSFSITQEYLSEMLGASRPFVSRVAAELQQAGLIRYSRGTMSVLDREGLLRRSCECYSIVRKAFEDRSLGFQQ